MNIGIIKIDGQNERVTPQQFVDRFGVGSEYKIYCTNSSNDLKEHALHLKNKFNDKPYIFAHNPGSKCPYIYVQKVFDKYKRKAETDNYLKKQFCENREFQIHCYAVCSHFVCGHIGSEFLNVENFLNIFALACKYEIWDLYDANKDTLPYMLLLLCPFKTKNGVKISFVKKESTRINISEFGFNKFIFSKKVNDVEYQEIYVPDVGTKNVTAIKKCKAWVNHKRVKTSIIQGIQRLINE